MQNTASDFIKNATALAERLANDIWTGMKHELAPVALRRPEQRVSGSSHRYGDG
jgi:hypothetical protein